MTKSLSDNPDSLVILEQAVRDLTKVMAIEETVFSKILNFENTIIQKAENNSTTLEELITINDSVNRIIENIIKVQMVTREKLQLIEDLLQKIENFIDYDDLEE